MRTFSAWAGASALLAAILCNGCVVQSLQPFFTMDAVVPLANVWGEWDRIDEDGVAPGKPWLFGETAVLTYDKDKAASLQVVYFKVGKNAFVDATAGDLGAACANGFWVSNVVPVHTLAKIIQARDRLEVRPLDYEWLQSQVREHRVNLPRMDLPRGLDRFDSVPRELDRSDSLFTATPEEWMEFLKEHGDSNQVFPKENALTFTRHVEEAPAE